MTQFCNTYKYGSGNVFCMLPKGHGGDHQSRDTIWNDEATLQQKPASDRLMADLVDMGSRLAQREASNSMPKPTTGAEAVSEIHVVEFSSYGETGMEVDKWVLYANHLAAVAAAVKAERERCLSLAREAAARPSSWAACIAFRDLLDRIRTTNHITAARE